MEASPWANVPCDNTAFVFLTPNANTDSAAALVEKVFAINSLAIVREGELPCEQIQADGMLDTYYSAWSRFDKKPAAKSRHFADVMEGFQNAMGDIGFTEAAKKGLIYNPSEACSTLKLTPIELYRQWASNSSPEVPVTSGIVIKRFPEHDNKWIINGFFPALKALLEQKDKYIRWWVVQWPEKELEWFKFRDQVIGNKQPGKARTGSIREVLAKEWKSLGLAVAPNLLDSGVHGSGGPLEALSERITFTGIPFEEDELGRVIKNRYAEFGMELAVQWSQNNRISLNDEPFRPAFDVCENYQTSDFLDTIEQNILNDEAYLKFREKQARAPWSDYPFLDVEPEGISLEVVWPFLVDDNPFKKYDIDRKNHLKQRKPDQKAIKECENKMNERNHAVAKCIKLWPFLDQLPHGISLATVIIYLVKDPEFHIFDQKRVALMSDRQKNAKEIKVFEKKMNERNLAVAKTLKDWPFLHPMPHSIPINVVLPHLIKDKAFIELDKERLTLLKNPMDNAAKIKEIEAKMDIRNHCVAECLKGGWPFLDPFPEDIPLPTVIPHLKTDPLFLKLDRERIKLIDEDYLGNEAAVKEKEAAMNDRSHVLAAILKKYPFLDSLPEGIPIDKVLPFLLQDSEFMAFDDERLRFHEDANSVEIKKREVAMNDRSHFIAKAMADYPFLDPMPEGFMLAFVMQYLKHDKDFIRCDEERRALVSQDPIRNAARIKELELLMDDRNHFVAQALKDWPFLSPMPESLLLANVLPTLKEDDDFKKLDKERLKLMMDSGSDPAKIQEIERKMDERNIAVARAMKEYSFLSQVPEGVTLAVVLPHLKSSDPEFNSMDQQRKALIAKGPDDEKNRAKIKDYEERMNTRNHTMAIILRDYQFLDKVPEDIPLATVFPFLKEEPQFQRFDKERKFRRRSSGSLTLHAPRIKELEESMNGRNHAVAKMMRNWPFLNPMCGGVPLAVVMPAVLDRKDPDFYTIVNKRKRLLKDPLTNKEAIRDAELELDEYLAKLGAIMKDYPFLDAFPEGVSLVKVFPELKKREAFTALAYERETLLSPAFATPVNTTWQGFSEATLAKVADVETAMNDINVAVAYDFCAFLTQRPEGLKLIPEVLPTLKLDYQFGKQERKRRYIRNKIKNNRIERANTASLAASSKLLTKAQQREHLYQPLSNADDLEDQKIVLGLESQMDQRNIAIAKSIKYRPYLNKEPEGLALGTIIEGLFEDPQFAKADNEMKGILGDKYYQNEVVRLNKISDKNEDEETSDMQVSSVPTQQHHQPPNAQEIDSNPKLKQIIEVMNQRATGLASALKDYPYLDAVPAKDEEGDGMPLDSCIAEVKADEEFASLEKQRKAILQSGEHAEIEQEDKVAELEEKLRLRCRYVARVVFERTKLLRPDEEYPFLDVLPSGIPVRKVIPYLKQDIEFKTCDEERKALLADNATGKWNDAIKAYEEAMNARNLAVSATLKYWPFLDQFPQSIALAHVLSHLKTDPAFIELNKSRLALIKDGADSSSVKVKEIEALMNQRSHALAGMMKGYPFLDVIPEGIPLDAVFPNLSKDEEFIRCDAKRREVWAKLPDDSSPPLGVPKIDAFGRPVKKANAELRELETIMNDRNHIVAKAMKAWPFLDQLPEGIGLPSVLPCLILDKEFQMLDAERIPLLYDPVRHAVVIERIQKKMNDRNLFVARAIKSYRFLDPIPEGIPISTLIPFLEQDEKVFVSLNRRRLELMKDPIAHAKEIKKLESEMNDRSFEYARALKEYPFLDPLPEGIPLPFVLPLLRKDSRFIALDKERLLLTAEDPVKNAAKIAAIEVEMNERNLAVARSIKQYPFLNPLPHGLPIHVVLPVLTKDEKFLSLDSERIALGADPDGNKKKITEIEALMDERSHQVAELMSQYPFLDPMPQGCSLSVVLPLLKKDNQFLSLEQKRLALLSDPETNAEEIKKCEHQMNERSYEVARLLKQYPFLDALPHGIPLNVVFPSLSRDPEFVKFDAERLFLLSKQPQTASTESRIRVLESEMNERNLAVALALKSYPFLDPLPEGLPLAVVLPILKTDDQFARLDKERLELMSDPFANAGRIREIEIEMNERSHAIAKIQKLLMESYTFLDPLPEGLSLPCVVWTYLSVDSDFCDHDQQRKVLMEELLTKPSAGDSGKRGKIALLEQLMDERNHSVARMLKAEALRRSTKYNADLDIIPQLPAGLLASLTKCPFKRKPFAKIERESADDDKDAYRWVDVDFNKRNKAVLDWARIGDVYEGPQAGDALLPDHLHLSQLQHGITPECSLLVAISCVLQQDANMIRNLFVSKEVRRDGRYTFQFFRWDRWVRVEIDDTIPMVRDEPLYAKSPTCHWWPSLLEKAYAKFYGSYSNILNGNVHEALHDLTALPVIAKSLHPEIGTPAHPNYYKCKTWNRLQEDLQKRRVIASLTTHTDANNVFFGIKSDDGYGLRKVHVLDWLNVNDPTSERSVSRRASMAAQSVLGQTENIEEDEDEEMRTESGAEPSDSKKDGPEQQTASANSAPPPDSEDDLSHIILEIYTPHRKAHYSGPYHKGDADNWSEKAISAIKPNFEQEPYVIFIPLDEALRSFADIGVCYTGAVKSDPYYFVEAWTKATSGGSANFHTWRRNPIFPIQNKSDIPIVIVALVKQPDLREKKDWREAEEATSSSASRQLTAANEVSTGELSYPLVGITLAEQLPPPEISAEVYDHDTRIPTHLLTPNTCRFVHKGSYVDLRDVANEITLPPRSQAYLVPSTSEAGTIGSFMFSVFVPQSVPDDAIEMLPLDSFPPMKVSATLSAKERKSFIFEVNVRGVLRAEECETAAEKSKASNDNPDAGPSEAIHLLLTQDKPESKQGSAGDTLMDDFFAILVQGPSGHRLVGSMTKGMNYRELGALVHATRSGTYKVTIVCAKAANPAPVTLSVYSLPAIAYGLRSEGAPAPVETEINASLRRRGDELYKLLGQAGGRGAALAAYNNSNEPSSPDKSSAPATLTPKKPVQPPPGVLLKKAVAPPPGLVKKMVAGDPMKPHPPPGAKPSR